MRKFVYYVMVFGIFFIAFDKVALPKEEVTTGDVTEYNFRFEEVSKEGEKIVLFDNSGLEHIQYYVYEFSNDLYARYTYYYMGDDAKYLSKYSEVSANIVDYNYDEFMIKTLDSITKGTYEEVMKDLSEEINNNSIYIIY